MLGLLAISSQEIYSFKLEVQPDNIASAQENVPALSSYDVPYKTRPIRIAQGLPLPMPNSEGYKNFDVLQISGNLPLSGNYPLSENLPISGNSPIPENPPISANLPNSGSLQNSANSLNSGTFPIKSEANSRSISSLKGNYEGKSSYSVSEPEYSTSAYSSSPAYKSIQNSSYNNKNQPLDKDAEEEQIEQLLESMQHNQWQYADEDDGDDEKSLLRDGYTHYKSTSNMHMEGPGQVEIIATDSYHREVPSFDVSGFKHHHDHGEHHGEVHYHEHKHMHKHDHKQKHVHKHKQGHKHHHGHKHEAHHKHEHGHKHENHHKHDHHHGHKHSHHNEHKHNHKHAHKHGHHAGHKHHHDQHHKHDHGHKHKHGHHHHNDHKHDHHHGHKHQHHGEHKHNHGHKHGHKHEHGHKHGHHHGHEHHSSHGHGKW